MSDDDAKARKERAKRLQKEIDKLANKPPKVSEPLLGADTSTSLPDESPRDFIQRRMHELDEAEKAKRKRKPKPKSKG